MDLLLERVYADDRIAARHLLNTTAELDVAQVATSGLEERLAVRSSRPLSLLTLQ